MKGDLDAIGELTGGFNWKHDGPHWLSPARAAHLSIPENSRDALALGVAGQLSKRIADKLKLRQEIFLAELDLDLLYSSYYRVKQTRRYKPLPRFPAVERDFSLVFKDSGVTFRQITGAIYHLNIPEIESVQAMDLYRGKNLPPGTFSLMIRVTLQSREGTLTESRIAEISVKVQILGQTYAIRGDLDERYVQKLAKYVDEKMRAISDATAIVDTQKVAVLAALAIADELHSIQRDRGEHEELLREQAERCLTLVERALKQTA